MDQDTLPFFDELDDIEESNKLSWFLTHRFTARNPVVTKDGTQVHTYRELGWVRFFQDYRINDERDAAETENRPWSDIGLDARVYPFSFLFLNAELAWSPYNYHFNTLNLDTTLTTPGEMPSPRHTGMHWIPGNPGTPGLICGSRGL